MVAIAGAIIRQRNVRYPGLEGTMTYRSFHAAARWTFSEGERPALRPARQSASSSSSRRAGIRGCHSPGTGRITAPGSSWPQSTRIVQLKRRPTSNVDSMIVLRARRGGTGSKYVTFRGGLGRAIPVLLVGQAGVSGQFYMGENGPARIVLRAKKWDRPRPPSRIRWWSASAR